MIVYVIVVWQLLGPMNGWVQQGIVPVTLPKAVCERVIKLRAEDPLTPETIALECREVTTL